MKFPLLAIFVTLLALSGGDPALAAPTTKTGTSPWIVWDRATDRVVSHTGNGAAYPRAKQLSNGDILLGYHHGGGLGEYGTFVTLRRSRDGGKTWSVAQDVEGPVGERFWGFSNVDFAELGGGRILLVTAARGKALLDAEDAFFSECDRSELRLRFSEDFGATWGEPRAVAGGRGRVWEPSLVQLPGGELEIYYANEAADLATEYGLAQRIELIRSTDHGQTWSEPIEVSQHPGCRPGMPAATVLRSGHVACAQEMVHDFRSPWITRTLRGRPGKQDYVAQSEFGFGSAPFLLTAPDGASTLLAFHSRLHKAPPPEGAPVPWMFQDIYVQKGDADAQHFSRGSRPWPDLPPRIGAFFPSLLMKNDGTVVALASFITQGKDHTSRTVVRWIEGKLKPDAPTLPRPREGLAATDRQPTSDR